MNILINLCIINKIYKQNIYENILKIYTNNFGILKLIE